jgi:hypothetical protein
MCAESCVSIIKFITYERIKQCAHRSDTISNASPFVYPAFAMLCCMIKLLMLSLLHTSPLDTSERTISRFSQQQKYFSSSTALHISTTAWAPATLVQ